MTLRVPPDQIVRESRSGLLAAHATWSRVKLGRVAEVQNGCAFNSKLFNSEGTGLPLVRIRDVAGGSSSTFYSGEYDDAYVLRDGDLIVGMDGDFRVGRWRGGPALLNQRVCRVRVTHNEIYDERLLEYALPGYLDAINAATSSVTVKHLSSNTLLALPLPLPPRLEQERVVAAIEEQFSRLDDAEASLLDALNRAAVLRMRVLDEAVAGDWPVTPLGDLLLRLRNGVFVSRPAAAPPGVPIFRISAVRPLSLDTSDVRYAPVDDGVLENYGVQPGDLLFTRYSGNPEFVGACAVVPELRTATLHPDKLIRGVVDRQLAEPDWLCLAANVGNGRRQIESRLKTTAGQVGIAGSALRTVGVPLPPLDDQRSIVAEVERQLSILDSLGAAIDHALVRSKQLRRAILERAFTGRLVPQDPSDEPASGLLERIAAERVAEPPARRGRRRAKMETT